MTARRTIRIAETTFRWLMLACPRQFRRAHGLALSSCFATTRARPRRPLSPVPASAAERGIARPIGCRGWHLDRLINAVQQALQSVDPNLRGFFHGR